MKVLIQLVYDVASDSLSGKLLVILLLLVHKIKLECQSYFQWKNLEKPLKPSFVTLRASKG